LSHSKNISVVPANGFASISTVFFAQNLRQPSFMGLSSFSWSTILRQQGVDALAEVWVKLSNTRVLVPDVIAAPNIQDPYPTEPVTLCVEILSPGDRLSTAFAKWGVPHCWVIDPVSKPDGIITPSPIRLESNETEPFAPARLL
jgi:Uma2 family endonuclease